MLPMETKHSIPAEISSFQNTTLSDGNQRQMCLLPSKQHRCRNPNHHISSTLIHDCMIPFESECGMNNKMIPFGYYLQPGQYVDNNNRNLHQILPFSVSLNPSFTSLESSVSASTFNEVPMRQTTTKMQFTEFNSSFGERPLPVYSTQKTDYENFNQPYQSTNQQHMLTRSDSLSTASSSSIAASVVPPVKTKRKYTRRPHRSPVEQQLLQYPHTSTKPIFSNYWPSLPLPSLTDTLTRPGKCKFPVDFMRTSNFAPLSSTGLRTPSDSPIINSNSNSRTVQQHSLPYSTMNTFERYQTFEQCLPDQRCGFVRKPINNYSTNNLSYNMPYFLTAPHEHYYMLPSNPMAIHLPAMACSTLTPELNTTFLPPSFSNDMKKVRKERDDPQKSGVLQNSTVEEQINETNIVSTPLITKILPVIRRRLQKKSKIEDNRTKTLMKRMTARNKLAVLKFMIRKRKQQQQQLSKKKLSEAKIETIVPQIVDSDISKTTKIIASGLKITFNTAQQIESISLYYHQRHEPENKAEHPLMTSNNTDNRLDLLIEAVKFIEMCNDDSKLALESID